MPDMAECPQSGLPGMCETPEVKAAFPLVCTTPSNPHTGEGAPQVSACAAGSPAAAPAPAPQQGAATSAAWDQLAPQAAAFVLGALLAAMLV